MHSRRACSRCAQPPTPVWEEAQQFSIADMGPMQGFGSCLSGRLIFNFDTDCSRIGATAVEAPLDGMMEDEWELY